MIQAAMIQAAQELGSALSERAMMLATAESCTGGMIAMALTEAPGASGWFERGYVTYSNRAKTDLLAVPADTIEQFGAVSEEVALAMALGALQSNATVRFALSVTGIAGPSGGSAEKPVGTVVHGFAWKSATQAAQCHHRVMRHHYSGDRAEVRLASAAFALKQALFLLQTEC
ncbi:MAG: CinA family protein [Betaproteobacteria bacterium]|nr:CinA family protein [Pseudomonadota bacterium]NCX63610.1 CinA family protein [Betaproteobacteria bacterium]NCZ74854.1 CinA family protein [Betaproteobacteria bacterium]NDA04701.1 CinA family protein [Betaproteobacteria bacterium]NDB99361.1 CinA family protein [Betaproteobacteria bacterium]